VYFLFDDGKIPDKGYLVMVPALSIFLHADGFTGDEYAIVLLSTTFHLSIWIPE
jgi:hypothetical protein